MCRQQNPTFPQASFRKLSSPCLERFNLPKGQEVIFKHSTLESLGRLLGHRCIGDLPPSLASLSSHLPPQSWDCSAKPQPLMASQENLLELASALGSRLSLACHWLLDYHKPKVKSWSMLEDRVLSIHAGIAIGLTWRRRRFWDSPHGRTAACFPDSFTPHLPPNTLGFPEVHHASLCTSAYVQLTWLTHPEYGSGLPQPKGSPSLLAFSLFKLYMNM